MQAQADYHHRQSSEFKDAQRHRAMLPEDQLSDLKLISLPVNLTTFHSPIQHMK